MDNDKKSRPLTAPVTSLSSVQANTGNIVFVTCLDGNVSLLDGASMMPLFNTRANTKIFSGALAKTSAAVDGPVSMFYAGEDGNVMQCVVGGNGRADVIGAHSGPIPSIKYSTQWGVVTGSCDKTVRSFESYYDALALRAIFSSAHYYIIFEYWRVLLFFVSFITFVDT